MASTMLLSTQVPIDCAICTGVIEDAACGRCMHHFCYTCIERYVVAADTPMPACPICRAPLEFVMRDKQYDALIRAVAAAEEEEGEACCAGIPERVHGGCGGATAPTAAGSGADLRAGFPIVTVDLASGLPAGLCLGRRRSGPGVRVTKVLVSGSFYKAGVRPDDVLLDIDGVPCCTVGQTVGLVNGRTEKASQHAAASAAGESLRARICRPARSAKWHQVDRPRKPPSGLARALPHLAPLMGPKWRRRSGLLSTAKAVNEDDATPGTWLEVDWIEA